MLNSGRLNRETINSRVRICVSAFAFGVSEELLAGDMAHALAAVKPLGWGESGARERRERPPVPWEHVDATLEFMASPVRALVLLMWLTGARPSELLELRPCDVDRSDDERSIGGLKTDFKKKGGELGGGRRTRSESRGPELAGPLGRGLGPLAGEAGRALPAAPTFSQVGLVANPIDRYIAPSARQRVPTPGGLAT